MGRKSNSKQNVKKTPSVPKENNKVLNQKRKELSVLIDKLLKLTSIFQTSISLSKSLEHYLEIDSILKQVKDAESMIQNNIGTKDRKSNIDEFLIWMKGNGAIFDDIVISDFKDYDLGLKATKDFAEGSLLLSIPRKIMMTETEAHSSELSTFIAVDPLLQNMPNVTLALYLLLEKSNPDSFWKPYINILPEKYSTILYFSSDELNELRPSPVLEQSLKLCRSIARQYAYFYNKIFTLDLPVLKKLRDIFSYENYRWAVSTVMTRQSNLSNLVTTAFIPFWDMCNHEHGKITTDYNVEKKQGECYALRDFKQGEQIFIYYGARPNSDLFVHNGFVYPENKQDSLSLALGISSGDPLHETRLELLGKLGLAAVTHYSLYNTETPISPELLAFIRIFNMNKDELNQWSSSGVPGDLVSSAGSSAEAVGPSLDIRAYTYLKTRCELVRASYNSRNNVENGELSSLRKNIKLLKDCEINILEHTIKFLQDAILKLPTKQKTQ